MPVLTLSFVAALAALVDTQSALDYTQWRGNNRDGSASGFVEPSSWPKALTRKWTVDVGEGYATPLVVGDTVYVFTRRDGEEVMTALHAVTGRARWRSAYPARYAPSKPAVVHGSGPKATAITVCIVESPFTTGSGGDVRLPRGGAARQRIVCHHNRPLLPTVNQRFVV